MKKELLGLTAATTAVVAAFTPMKAEAWHHCHGGFWGRGGHHFWPGFVGGVVGGLVGGTVYGGYRHWGYAAPVVYSAPVVTTPTIIQQPAPVVVQQPVVQQPAPTVVQQPAPTVVQQPVVQQSAPQVKVVVEHRYLTAEEAARAAAAARQNQNQ